LKEELSEVDTERKKNSKEEKKREPQEWKSEEEKGKRGGRFGGLRLPNGVSEKTAKDSN